MASKLYYVQWRSVEMCSAMELTEPTSLPVEDWRMDMGSMEIIAEFKAGDYEVRQDGRVFGREKAVHEGRFKRVRGGDEQ